jgi:type I restriction enzyme, S subunit
MSWPLCKLDQLGSVARGRSRHRPRDAAHLYGGPYPFVQTGDVKHSGLYITQFSQTYSEAGLAQSKLWPAGTLCITIAANIADAAILNFDACFPDSIIGFIPDPQKADTRFIKYLFDAILQKRFQQFTQGAAQDNLSQEKLLSLEFPVPADVDEQTRIAELVSAYDDLIENNRRRIQLLEQSARLLYKEWFVQLRFPGHEHANITKGVPEGWRKASLVNLCDTVDYGYTASADSEPVGPKFLRITDIVPDIIDWSAVPYCLIEDGKIEKYQLREGDIVIARTGATVGYAKRLHKRHPEAVFASYLVRLRLKPEVDDLMVGVFVESDIYKNYIKSRVGGAAQPNANAQVLASAGILIPPPNIARGFCELVGLIADQKETLRLQNEQLREARDLLIPRLMNGSIKV